MGAIQSFGTTFNYVQQKLLSQQLLDAFRLHFLLRHWQAELLEYREFLQKSSNVSHQILHQSWDKYPEDLAHLLLVTYLERCKFINSLEFIKGRMNQQNVDVM